VTQKTRADPGPGFGGVEQGPRLGPRTVALCINCMLKSQ